MTVLVITGMPGAGKEEFVGRAMSLGYEVVRMGDVVRAEAQRMNVALNEKGVGGFATEEREKHGYDIWAKRAITHVRSEHTIIDGCRGLMELAIFKKDLNDVKLIAIHSSPSTRFPRLQARKRYDAPQTWEEFQLRDDRELSWGLGSLIAMADVMIVNETTIEDFRSNCLRFLKGLE